MNTIKTYDAYLTFKSLTTADVARIRDVFARQNLLVTLDDNALEFEFAGRDLSDFIVHIFQQVAQIVRDAEGEIRCEIEDDDYPDPCFIFYSIRQGVLWEQHAKVVRAREQSRTVWNPPSGKKP